MLAAPQLVRIIAGRGKNSDKPTDSANHCERSNNNGANRLLISISNMPRTTTKSLSIRISSRQLLRVAVPQGFRAACAPFDKCTVELRREGNDGGAPDLLLICMPRDQQGTTLAESLKRQRAAATANPRRRLKVCRQARVGGLACALIEVYDRREKLHDVTYLRLLGDSAILCGYRYGGVDRPKELDAAARKVLRTIDSSQAVAAVREPSFAVRKAGFYMPLPAGWERQDLFGQIFAFAPGTGFRPRISVSLHTSRDDCGTDAAGDREAINALQAGQREICSGTRFNSPRRQKHAGGRSVGYAWSGTLKRSGDRICGRIVILSTNRGRALLMYQAQSGTDFKRHEPEFEQAIAAIRWNAGPRNSGRAKLI